MSDKGWECPKCGKINAPWVRECDCKNLKPDSFPTILPNKTTDSPYLPGQPYYWWDWLSDYIRCQRTECSSIW